MSAHRYRLAVSIINYRTFEMTLRCVQSVLDDIGGIDARIVVVDNASGDGSAERLTEWRAAQPDDFPVELVLSPTNTGFSGGHNLGMGACAADFYLLLNSDAVLRPGFCKAILAAAEAHPEAGFLAPRLEYDDGTPQVSSFRFHSPLSELIRCARTAQVTRLLKSRDVSIGTDPGAQRIDWASFACILLRDAMVEALGPMDEGYFLYFEDAEYCLRGRRAGWSVVHVPQAVTVHYRGGSGPVKALAAARKPLPAYYYASRTRFLYQAHGMAGLWSANLLWYLGRAIAQLKRLGGKRVGPMPAGEARAIWTNAFDPLGPRLAPHEAGSTRR